jgi:hypothetical protein
MVLNNGTLYFRGNSTAELNEGVTRRQIAGVSINVVCMLMIFVLCYLCLVIVLVGLKLYLGYKSMFRSAMAQSSGQSVNSTPEIPKVVFIRRKVKSSIEIPYEIWRSIKKARAP